MHHQDQTPRSGSGPEIVPPTSPVGDGTTLCAEGRAFYEVAGDFNALRDRVAVLIDRISKPGSDQANEGALVQELGLGDIIVNFDRAVGELDRVSPGRVKVRQDECVRRGIPAGCGWYWVPWEDEVPGITGHPRDYARIKHEMSLGNFLTVDGIIDTGQLFTGSEWIDDFAFAGDYLAFLYRESGDTEFRVALRRHVLERLQAVSTSLDFKSLATVQSEIASGLLESGPASEARAIESTVAAAYLSQFTQFCGVTSLTAIILTDLRNPRLVTTAEREHFQQAVGAALQRIDDAPPFGREEILEWGKTGVIWPDTVSVVTRRLREAYQLAE